MPQFAQVQGELTAQVKVTQPLSKTNRDIIAQSHLMGWQIVAERPVLHDVELQLNYHDRLVTMTILRASAAKANLTGEASLDFPSDGPMKYFGHIALRGFDGAYLWEIYPRPDWLKSAIVDLNGQFEGEGSQVVKLRADGTIAGQTTDIPLRSAEANWNCNLQLLHSAGQPLPWLVAGRANITAGPIMGVEDRFSNELKMDILFEGDRLRAENISGDLAGGTLNGTFELVRPPDGPFAYRGRFDAVGVNVEAFGKAIGRRENRRGVADLHYAFNGRGTEIEALQGNGDARTRQTGMESVPLVRAIIFAMSLGVEAIQETNLRAEFSHRGWLATLHSARMATPVLAIDALPNGHVNIKEHEVDFYVVAGVLKDIKPLLNFPIARLFVPLTQRLSRLHVTGRWDSMETIAVTKEPLKDIAAGTMDFFTGLIKSPQQFAESIFGSSAQGGD